jgi:CheY-like chemotaxis protein
VKNAPLKPADLAAHPDAKPGNYLCVSVADTGTGIPAEQLGKIFEPFFTTKAPGKGTGLGLSTSLSIIKNHGGFITVHSEEGRGTEFKFYLPVATETPVETAPEKISLPPGSGECILVVDDEEAILAIMRSTLENYGYQVLTAGSGVEAIARFTQNSDAVHLVITDLAMPFMDGRAAIQALRKIRSDVKVIVASGSDKEVEDLRKQIRTDAFLPKPFTNENLLTIVHQVLAD